MTFDILDRLELMLTDAKSYAPMSKYERTIMVAINEITALRERDAMYRQSIKRMAVTLKCPATTAVSTAWMMLGE
jgi:hypothetical protein